MMIPVCDAMLQPLSLSPSLYLSFSHALSLSLSPWFSAKIYWNISILRVWKFYVRRTVRTLRVMCNE